MENVKCNVKPEDHELYLKTLDLHVRNNTMNHEEDERAILDIVSAGLAKLSEIHFD